MGDCEGRGVGIVARRLALGARPVPSASLLGVRTMAVKKYSGKSSGPANPGPLLRSQGEKMGVTPQSETWRSVRRGNWRKTAPFT